MVQVATVSPPVGQFVIHTLLQIAGFAVAIAFGVYAVRSVHAAVLANSFSREANNFSREAIQQAFAANQLALLATCLQAGNQTENRDITDICSRIIRGAAADLLSSAASSLFPDLPPPPSPSSSPDDSSSTLSPPTPTPTPTRSPLPAPTGPSTSASRSSVSTGAVAGAVIGSALLVATVSVTCIYIRRRRRRRHRRGHSSRRHDHDDSTTTPTPPPPPPPATRRRPASSFVSIFREVFMNSTMTSWTPNVDGELTTTRDEERGGQTERQQREK
ncbi:hypothetical protein CLCR_03047 [Cladophialophora carrionii]|uniref:Uncharacterized protein n=1 Tax=Cladophialophora carrionii TaxID=86049 RepID=A0A1C1D1P4_9EURO|nr:hypothetical protein CLCR_03047 [Cladophialophora carrionii]